jgi:hypothetical protein
MLLLSVDLTIQDVLIGVLSLAIIIIGFFLAQYFSQQKETAKEHGLLLSDLTTKIGDLHACIKVIQEGFSWMKSTCNERHDKIEEEFVRLEKTGKRK